MGEEKIVKISTGEILYWLFFGSLLFAKGIGLYDGQFVFKIVLIFASCCLFIKILIEKYSIVEYVGIALIIGLSVSTYAISGEKGLLLYGMMMVGMKNVNLKRIFGLGTFIWTVTFLSTTISALFRMDSTVYKVHAKLGLGHIFRWSLGYPHPNVLQISYLLFAMFIIYMIGDRFRMKHALWLFAGNCLIFLYSVSYTGFIVCLFLILGRIYLLYRREIGKLEYAIIMAIYPVCIITSLVLPIALKGHWFDILNEVLNTRLELAQKYLQRQYISLWGVRLSEITSETMTMDNSYLFAFVTYGVVTFIAVCLVLFYTMYQYLNNKKYIEVLLMATIAVGGLTEPFLFNSSFKNITFLFMGAIFYGKKWQEKECSILPTRLNKCIDIKRERLVYPILRIKKYMKDILRFNWKTALIAVGYSVIMLISFEKLHTYPKGYVIDRVNCADITEEKNYYQNADARNDEMKEMRSFQEGDEVEYFSGNIVLMERIRDGIIVCISSYIISYVIVVNILKIKGKKI